MSRILDDRRKYLLAYYAGAKGFLGWILRWYWGIKIAGMKEGEVLNRYYAITGGVK